MRNKLGKVLMILGVCCLTAAALLVVYNRSEERRVQTLSQDLLVQLDAKADAYRKSQQLQMDDPAGLSGNAALPAEPEQKQMDAVEIDGKAYIGKLLIPELGIELPVLSDWSRGNLRLAPCRYAGDLYTRDLVIMAHNYVTHFGRISTLTPGADICFYDMNQNMTAFEVVTIETLRPNQVEEMTAGEYPLTLFTCSYSGQSRIAVRCQEKKN